MSVRLMVTLVLGFALAISACAGPVGPCDGVLCDVCDRTVTVRVNNARTGLAVETATATVGDAPCQCEAGLCGCSIQTVGTHPITVAANGYVSSTVTVSLARPDAPPGACCVCEEPSPRQQTVLLEPR